MTTTCQGEWRHAEQKEDGEGGYVQRLVCTGCDDEWYIAYPAGRTIATRVDGVLIPEGRKP